MLQTGMHKNEDKKILILVKSSYIFSSPGRSPEELMFYPPALASTFTLNFFKSSYFLNHLMDLVHIWYNDRNRSKLSIRNIQPWHIGHKDQKLGHKVKS